MANRKRLGILLVCTGTAAAAFVLLHDLVKGEGAITLGPTSTPLLIMGVVAAGIGIGLLACKRGCQNVAARCGGKQLVLLAFLVLLGLHLGIALTVYAPAGYYGTRQQPRFSDPWFARSETILRGGLLYRDTYTKTPPLTNYLLVPPSLVARESGYRNPAATLSFMVYFAIFSLFTAWLLLYMCPSRKAGLTAALLFLANPLTLGNAVLRRQDEAVLTFFVCLCLFLSLWRRHLWSAVAIGLTMLVKLGGLVLIPIALLHSRKWQYVVIPMLVVAIGFAPFLVLAGKGAMIWDSGIHHNEHPFQFGGVSLWRLWNSTHKGAPISIEAASIVLLSGVAMALGLVAWKRFGLLADTMVLLTAALVLTPKLHTGYFSILVCVTAPLLKRRAEMILFMVFGLLAMMADYLKYPVRCKPAAFWLMAVALGALLGTVILIIRRIWCEHSTVTDTPTSTSQPHPGTPLPVAR